MVHTHLEIQGGHDLYASAVRRPCAKCLNDVQPSGEISRVFDTTRGRVNEGLEFSGERSPGFAEIYGTRRVLSLSLSLSPRVFRFYRGSRVGRFEWLIDNVLILKGVCYWKRCEVMWRNVFLKNRSKIFIEIRCLFFESVLYWKVIENRKRFFGYSDDTLVSYKHLNN